VISSTLLGREKKKGQRGRKGDERAPAWSDMLVAEEEEKRKRGEDVPLCLLPPGIRKKGKKRDGTGKGRGVVSSAGRVFAARGGRDDKGLIFLFPLLKQKKREKKKKIESRARGKGSHGELLRF